MPLSHTSEALCDRSMLVNKNGRRFILDSNHGPSAELIPFGSARSAATHDKSKVPADMHHLFNLFLHVEYQMRNTITWCGTSPEGSASMVLNVPANHEQILTLERNTCCQLPNESFETGQVDGQVPNLIQCCAHCPNLHVSCLTIWIYLGCCVFVIYILFST